MWKYVSGVLVSTAPPSGESTSYCRFKCELTQVDHSHAPWRKRSPIVPWERFT